MSKVKILVEGVADAKFIQDLVKEWYNFSLDIAGLGKSSDIIHLDGKDAFDSASKLAKLSNLFEKADFLSIPVVVIFDADHYPDNHQLFTTHSQTHGFSFFLLPDNEADGDLETLLQDLIHLDNQIIFDCWEAYESCINGKQTAMTELGVFTLTARKTKIYAYLEALVGDSGTEKEKIKERYRDYRNPNHWNLDSAHPPLKPLKDFLDQFFSA